MIEVLITDPAGQPRHWTNFREAVCYHSRGKVLFTIGDPIKTFYGGRNDRGEQSRVDITPIIGTSGPIDDISWKNHTTKYVERTVLYGRDQRLCAYCGFVYPDYKLTIDHVKPKSRYAEYGLSKADMNVWTNCVTSCKSCNLMKGCKTPEEAGMPLLYVPYTPNAYEKMILKSKNILADQMKFLMEKVPKKSRLWTDPRYKALWE